MDEKDKKEIEEIFKRGKDFDSYFHQCSDISAFQRNYGR